MLRKVVSIVSGFVVWSVLWLGSNFVIKGLMPDRFAPDGSTDSAGILVGLIILSFIFSIIAGFTTASLAHGNRMQPAFILGIVQLVIGIFVQGMYWHLLPLWYHLIFLVLLIPGILLGARMRVSREVAGG
jgi:hypothetical protein